MSKLDELIQQYCPDGVEYKAIQEISKNISSGGTPKTTRKDFYDGDIPWLRTQEVNFCDITDTGVKITKDGLKNSSAKWIPENCVIVAMYGATVGKIGINKIPLTTNQACCNLEIDSNKALYKYVFYCLANQYEYIKSLGQGAQTNINAQIVKNLEIPVPPLPVQEEIVRILDKFTSLTAELTAELTARRKQYEYYRDALLTKEAKVEIKKLGEIGKVCMCKRIMKDQTSSNGEIPFFKIGTFGKEPDAFISKELFEEYKQKYTYPKKGDILISAAGTIGRTVIFDGEPAYFQDSNIVWIDNDEKQALNKYLYYCYQRSPWKISTGGTIARLYNENIENAEIPLPPLSVQERIVNVLDNFDAICSDLNIGLPAEIDARKKQYEYYRDLLLTFAERGNTISSSSAVQQFSSSAVQQFSSSAVQQFSSSAE